MFALVFGPNAGFSRDCHENMHIPATEDAHDHDHPAIDRCTSQLRHLHTTLRPDLSSRSLPPIDQVVVGTPASPRSASIPHFHPKYRFYVQPSGVVIDVPAIRPFITASLPHQFHVDAHHGRNGCRQSRRPAQLASHGRIIRTAGHAFRLCGYPALRPDDHPCVLTDARRSLFPAAHPSRRQPSLHSAKIQLSAMTLPTRTPSRALGKTQLSATAHATPHRNVPASQTVHC